LSRSVKLISLRSCLPLLLHYLCRVRTDKGAIYAMCTTSAWEAYRVIVAASSLDSISNMRAVFTGLCEIRPYLHTLFFSEV
jgi:hypothetical protein